MKYKTHGHYSYTVNALETYNNECVNCTTFDRFTKLIISGEHEKFNLRLKWVYNNYYYINLCTVIENIVTIRLLDDNSII
ncbi:hypothetical protein EB796_016636 [Bugula neritina]|uniref:Uncharacterized protein n=1 Tax=Bugula neritina TaxID=10212 RepID=A0A7J7JFI0_BUGNE|nr:hypothetical protein EB796_016636 [Bugula neritina]